MTGFGRGTAQAAGVTVTVEVRSVNGRYAEVGVRAPRTLAPHEATIQQRAKATLERGKISVNVQVEQTGEALPLRIDEQAAAAYGRLLHRLRDAAGIERPVELDHLLAFRDALVQQTEAEADAETVWAATQTALDEALAAIQQMRRQEGEALAADLHARLDAIEQELAAVETAAPVRIATARETFHTRLAEVLGDGRVDRDRLELEIALLADKLDVTEECVRLRSHLAQFREAMAHSDAVGRRLNFLAQEFNREINTIASKANDAAIAHRAVTMKEELEKIREQVQNVV